MEAVFLKLLTVSVNASWLVFAVMILRILFRRAPKSIRCMLWAFAAIRLIFPFSPESEWSLIPDTEFVLSGILQTEAASPETFHSGTTQTEANVTEVSHLCSHQFSPDPQRNRGSYLSEKPRMDL